MNGGRWMKIVQSTYRQYQLVDKTKKKDLDGVVYLVAGEKNLWVKMLKDKSAAKREQIAMMISQGSYAGFEKPLEIVNDGKGAFVGYTFRGPDMEIVPEKVISNKTGESSRSKKTKISSTLSSQMPSQTNFGTSQNNSLNMSNFLQWLILGIVGVIMFILMKFVLNQWLLTMIYTGISQVAAEGCAKLSFGGILPGVGGIAGLLFFHNRFGKDRDSVPVYCLLAVVAFLAGAIAVYAVVGVICVIVIRIFGVVQAYQSVILTVIVLAVVVKYLISGSRK